MPTHSLENPAKCRTVQASDLPFRRDQCRLALRDSGLLKHRAYGLYDVGREWSKRGIWDHVLIDFRIARAQERVLEFFDRQRHLSSSGFEEIMLDFRVQVRVNDSAVGFEHRRLRQRLQPFG